LSVLLGIRVLARTRPQRKVLKGAADGVLGSLAEHPNYFRLFDLKHVIRCSGPRRVIAAS
jgi:hypothetical protein